MILNPHGLKFVYGKTNGKCCLCGSEHNIVCTGFIPEWTRVVLSLDNAIPICDDCRFKRQFDFIELGKLKYLNEMYIEMLMRFYRGERKYIKTYVRRFGSYRTRGKLDVDYALTVLSSYDEYISMNEKKLDWENLGGSL